MNKVKYSLLLLTLLTIVLGSGCSTRNLDAAMVHYTPKDHMTKRTDQQLLTEASKLLEFEISADDFRSTYSEEGHTCWIILTHVESAPAVVDRIKDAKGYQHLATGQFDPQYRAVFGFKPQKEVIAHD